MGEVFQSAGFQSAQYSCVTIRLSNDCIAISIADKFYNLTTVVL